MLRCVVLLLATLLPALADAVALTEQERQAGASLYQRCQGCHALAYHRTGPRHCDLFGRQAGSLEGFDYSKAMRASGIIWTSRTLDRFLSNPLEMIPGTTMGYAGITEPPQRALLIRYLEWATTSAQHCPQH